MKNFNVKKPEAMLVLVTFVMFIMALPRNTVILISTATFGFSLFLMYKGGTFRNIK
ncbi:MAG: hypothetical protein FWG10_11050 [Eubacteriaceae bacterium]|nr:hypothetical protein [Eubacteriaceae bacterium]